MDWLELGATLLGGYAGSKAGGDTTQTATANKEPWAPAHPYLLDNLKTNANLQQFYQQNPFNDQQKTSYNNLFGDLNNFRNNTAPGLMDFANNAMSGGGYQRPQLSAPGQGGYGPRPQMQQPQMQQMQPMQQPIQQARPFSVAQSEFGGGGNDDSIEGMYRKYLSREAEAGGLNYWKDQFGDSIDPNEVKTFLTAAQPEINMTGGSVRNTNYTAPDWNAQNPFSAQNKPVQQAAPTQLLQQIGQQALGGAYGGLLGNNQGGQGGRDSGGFNEGGASFGGDNSFGGFGFGSDNPYGIGSEFNGEKALSGAKAGSAFGIGGMALGGLLNGLIGGYMSPAEQAKQVADMDARVKADEARKRAASFTDRGGYGGGSFGGSNYGGNDSHSGDSSHGTRG